jgi:hypothetical protein
MKTQAVIMLNDDELSNIRVYLEKLFGQKIEKKKIKSITVNPLYHGQNRRTIVVGKTYSDLEPNASSEQVLAIFESKSYLVCTAERGALQGMPYIFTRDTILSVEEEE